MPDVSNIVLQVTYTWSVNEDGSQGELRDQTAPRWTDLATSTATGNWDHMLEHLGAKPTADVENEQLRALLAEHGIEVPSALGVSTADTTVTNERTS